MSDRSSERREERTVQLLLRGGLIVSSLLMAVGLVWALAIAHLRSHAVSFRTVAHYVATGHPTGLMAVGLFVLLALPVARVVVLIVDFSRERDWRYAAVALAVLTLLALAILVGRS